MSPTSVDTLLGSAEIVLTVTSKMQNMQKCCSATLASKLTLESGPKIRHKSCVDIRRAIIARTSKFLRSMTLTGTLGVTVSFYRCISCILYCIAFALSSKELNWLLQSNVRG